MLGSDRSLTSGGVYTALNLGVTQSSTEFLDTGAELGTIYYYKVTAVDAPGNESALSAFASGTRLPPPDVTPPAAPTGLVAGGQQNQTGSFTFTSGGELPFSGGRTLI